jgi:hypothetical protein
MRQVYLNLFVANMKKKKKRKEKKRKMHWIIWIFLIIWIIVDYLQSFQIEKDVLIYVGNQTHGCGFFWVMYNILHVVHYAQKYNMDVHIELDEGLYWDECKNKKDWFSNYFKPIQLQKENFDLKKSICPIEKLSDRPTDKISTENPKVYKWDTLSFKSRDFKSIQYNLLWKSYFQLQPLVQTRLTNFENQKQWQDSEYKIGVHYRGTDKYGNKTQHEDFPEHPELECFQRWICTEVLKNLKKVDTICVLLCSDEQPFIDHLKSFLLSFDWQKENSNRKKVYVLETQSIRANISTNGLHLTSIRDCGADWNGPEYLSNPACIKYKSLASESIHRGMKHVSNYTKGEDVLIDVLLLAQCNIFYRSHGNVSNFPGYLSPKLQIVDVIELYKKEKRKKIQIK